MKMQFPPSVAVLQLHEEGQVASKTWTTEMTVSKLVKNQDIVNRLSPYFWYESGPLTSIICTRGCPACLLDRVLLGDSG